jgi:hypothetical protein
MEDFSESSSVRMEREMLFMGDGSFNSRNNLHASSSSPMKMRMRQQQQEQQLEDTSDSTPQEDVMEDHSNTSLEAFDNEIRRMTKDADKILDDIRQSSRSHSTSNTTNGRGYRSVRPSTSSSTKSASIIIDEEKTNFMAAPDGTYNYYGETDTDDDADTIDDDDNASLQSELARLDRVAALQQQQQQQQQKLGLPHANNNKTVLVDVMSPWKWPPQQATIIDTERASSAGADPKLHVNDLSSTVVHNTTAIMMTATILWGLVLYLVAHGLLVRLVDDNGQVRIWW